jgi:hypothetical protein
MQDHDHDTIPRPSTAFTPEFIARLEERDEPLTAAQADAAGPWILEELPSPGWAVFRRGESLAAGDRPVAVFRQRERTLLAAAVLPGTGFERLFRLAPERGPEGYAVLSNGEVVGHLEHYDPDLLAALHTAEALLRLPENLARFLLASGAVTLKRTDRLLARADLIS